MTRIVQAERQGKQEAVRGLEQELRTCQEQLEQHADSDPDKFQGKSERTDPVP